MTLSEAKIILSTYKMPMTSIQLKLFKEAFHIVCRATLAVPNQ
jgi:hypothetical protein